MNKENNTKKNKEVETKNKSKKLTQTPSKSINKSNSKVKNSKSNENIKNNNNSSKTTNTVIKIIIGLVLIATISFSAFKIINWNNYNKKNSKVMADIKETAVIKNEENGKEKLDTSSIKEQYPNLIAWLRVEGTNIDFPIVQAKDNSFYLSHSVDNSYNEAGWMFFDYDNKLDGTDKNIIIYGHNRRDGSQFGSMKNILNSEWYDNENNRYITFLTENENTRYEVFSVYKIEDEDYYITTSFRNGEFEKFVNTLKNRSIKNFNVDVSEDDSILTLSTCANNNKYRVVLHAKKLEE